MLSVLILGNDRVERPWQVDSLVDSFSVQFRVLTQRFQQSVKKFMRIPLLVPCQMTHPTTLPCSREDLGYDDRFSSFDGQDRVGVVVGILTQRPRVLRYDGRDEDAVGTLKTLDHDAIEFTSKTNVGLGLCVGWSGSRHLFISFIPRTR